MSYKKGIYVFGILAVISILGVSSAALSNAGSTALLAYAAIAILVLLSFALWLANAGSKSFAQLQSALDKIEQNKDLSIRAPAIQQTELNDTTISINHLLDHFSTAIAKINGNTEMVFELGAQIAAASSEVASASDQQLESAASVSDNVINLSASISQVAANSNDVRSLTTEAHGQCKSGEASMKDVANDISSINTSFQVIYELTQSLSKRSDDIVSIVDVIRSIAEQTNLLALNAAIEAARAGEQGRGFAVVADEVRNLAQRTHDATGQVTVMVEAIRNETGEAVQQMDHNHEKVSQCVERVNETAEILAQISNNSSVIELRSTEIATATDEQNNTSNHVESQVKTIADLSVQSNASIHKSNSAIYGLLSQAVELNAAAREYSAVARDELNGLLAAITEVRMNAVLATNVTCVEGTRDPIEKIQHLDKQIASLWQSYIQSPRYSISSADAENFWQAWSAFKEARSITLARAANGDFAGARENAAQNAGPKFKAARTALEGLIVGH